MALAGLSWVVARIFKASCFVSVVGICKNEPVALFVLVEAAFKGEAMKATALKPNLLMLLYTVKGFLFFLFSFLCRLALQPVASCSQSQPRVSTFESYFIGVISGSYESHA